MQAIINPSEDALFNIISSVCNVEELEMMDVRAGVGGRVGRYLGYQHVGTAVNCDVFVTHGMSSATQW
jgi:hypothetical protein